MNYYDYYDLAALAVTTAMLFYTIIYFIDYHDARPCLCYKQYYPNDDPRYPPLSGSYIKMITPKKITCENSCESIGYEKVYNCNNSMIYQENKSLCYANNQVWGVIK